MRKLKKTMACLMMTIMVVAALSACGNGKKTEETSKDTQDKVVEETKEDNVEEEPKKDVIRALLPPVSGTYQDNFEKWEEEFNKLYPNLTLEIEAASWEDMTSKLDIQVQAGSPPDIAFVGSGSVPKYLDTELLIDISKYATPEMLEDFDSQVLDYFRNGDGIYGMPAYAEIHGIGGNREMLEEAGIDWKRIQKEGWTYEEFREAIKAGTVTKDGQTRYGFVFACSGVTAKDYLNIFVRNAGMPSPFTKDLKYAYTSQNFLKLLEALRELIDDGSMPKELSSVDAGKRWNMFLTGQTMITGKGLSVFERSAKLNNEKLDAGDNTAVEGSIKTEYIILPVPTFFGHPYSAAGAVDGYIAFRGIEEPTEEHLQNVAKAMYFLASGEVAAHTCSELYIEPISNTAREVFKTIPIEGKNTFNTEAQAIQVAQMTEARPDITPELGAKHERIMDEVVVPKFQALLADEITPQEMYDAVKAAAIEAFGAENIVVD